MTRQIITPSYVECPDTIRCGQTTILMILKHFLPERDWTFADADKICGYVEGKTTWNMTGILGMIDQGFETVSFYNMDRQKFADDPVGYLPEIFGDKEAALSIGRSDMASAGEAAGRLLASPHDQYFQRDWEWSDVDRLLDEGYLLMVWVDSRKLYSRHDQSQIGGHFVLVYGYSTTYEVVNFHDGGSFLRTEDEGNHECNRNRAARFGLDYFMNAAKRDDVRNSGGSNMVAFRLRKK